MSHEIRPARLAVLSTDLATDRSVANAVPTGEALIVKLDAYGHVCLYRGIEMLRSSPAGFNISAIPETGTSGEPTLRLER